MFQVAHVILTPNSYDGEVGTRHGLPDRESLVVSADVPPQDGETAEQAQAREAANADHARRRQAEADQAAQNGAAQANTNAQANVQGHQLPNNGANGPPPAG